MQPIGERIIREWTIRETPCLSANANEAFPGEVRWEDVRLTSFIWRLSGIDHRRSDAPNDKIFWVKLAKQFAGNLQEPDNSKRAFCSVSCEQIKCLRPSAWREESGEFGRSSRISANSWKCLQMIESKANTQKAVCRLSNCLLVSAVLRSPVCVSRVWRVWCGGFNGAIGADKIRGNLFVRNLKAWKINRKGTINKTVRSTWRSAKQNHSSADEDLLVCCLRGARSAIRSLIRCLESSIDPPMSVIDRNFLGRVRTNLQCNDNACSNGKNRNQESGWLE